MSSIDRESASRQWHPVAMSSDLHYRHVFHATLLGRELALWRADDGYVNAWENRCLHRGVRLSIGINDGAELTCQYHGWRYANRTAGCTYIPAHPADAPARTLCNNTYPVTERNGLVWVCEVADGPPQPDNIGIDDGACLPLRAMPMNAPLTLVREVLEDSAVVTGLVCESFRSLGDFALQAASRVGPKHLPCQLTAHLQPLDAHRTVVRAVLGGDTIKTMLGDVAFDETEHLPMVPAEPHVLSVLRTFNHRLECLRRRIETRAADIEMPPPFSATFQPVSETLAAMPDKALNGRQAPLRLKVASIIDTARHIRAFELESINGQLPTAQPGAHIDVHLPNGLVRQYSLANGPGETDRYRIAVKRTVDSAGGSQALHESVRVGDVLAASVPRNNFVLRRDARMTLLIAGGIGITALISMARTLHHSGLPFQLHYFVSSADEVAFAQTLSALGASAIVHVGHDPAATRTRVEKLLRQYQSDHHVYLCGPQAMLDDLREAATRLQWPDEAVHFEYFGNPRSIERTSAFRVELARSGIGIDVPQGQSLLEALRAHQIDLPSSCEQGACGTCKVTVIEGDIEHQDVYLNGTERASGQVMMSCVSRARSERLVLDL